MHPIKPIAPGSSGPDVTNLQAALLFLISLPRNEIFNFKTFEPPNSPTQAELDRLAEKLRGEQLAQVFGEATKKLVGVFQIQQGLGDHLNGDVESTTAARLTELLKQLGAFNTDAGFVVRGQVTDTQGQPVAALVKVYDVDLRSLAPLGHQAVTNAEGAYEIAYTREQFARAEKGNADILVRVFDATTIAESHDLLATDEQGRSLDAMLVPETGDRERPKSILFNAPGLATINIVVQSTRPVVSEWAQLTLAVQPLLKTLQPAELNDVDRRFLQRELEVDGEQLRLWVLAAKAALDTDLVPEDLLPQPIHWLSEIRAAYDHLSQSFLLEWIAFYGWFREGLDSEVKSLLQASSDLLLDSLKAAGARHTIPDVHQHVRDGRTALDIIREALERYRRSVALEPAAVGEPATVGDTLNAVNSDWINRDQRLRLTDVWNTLDPDAADFEPRLAQIEVAPSELPKLAQTIRLKNLTLNHPGLITALQGTVPAHPDGTTSDAALAGLVTIASDRWLDLVYTHGTPPGSSIAPEDYARHLEKQTEHVLSNASLLAKIQAGKLFSDHPAFTKQIASILQRPDFNIAKTDIDEFVDKQPLSDDTKTDLKRLQHLKRVGVSWNYVEHFLNRGIDSISTIANYGRTQLHKVFETVISEAEINDIHKMAMAYQAFAVGLTNVMYPVVYGVETTVTGLMKIGNEDVGSDGTLRRFAVRGAADIGSEAMRASPTLRRLMGALEQCACDPCLSVLSPAAYLVDLLRYVDTSYSAKELLKTRRPDIYDLELSCDNSQIELPHIDLVLEILENAVAFPETIPLSAGTDAVSQLNTNPVGPDIRDKLEETAQEPLGNLQATPDALTTSLEKPAPDISYWVVSDRFRRWAVKVQSEAFGDRGLVRFSTDMNLAKIMNWTEGDVSDLLTWMDGEPPHFPIPPRSWSKAFRQMLERMNIFDGQPLVVSLANLSVRTIEPHRRWMVEYEVGGLIRIGPSNGGRVSVTITGADGSQSQTREYDQLSIQATLKAFRGGRLGGVFSTYDFADTTHSKIRVSPTGGGWSYSQTLSDIEIIYRPADLTIVGLSYQSTASDRDLLVRPQNRNPLAYQKLSQSTAAFPWTLPYDHSLTETRALLNQAGVPRLELLTMALPDSEQMSSDLWAREQLGLSEEQAKAIVGKKSGDDLWLAWGLRRETGGLWSVTDTFADESRKEPPLGTTANPGLLERVSIVLQQARIRFVELQALLATQFVTVKQTVVITPPHECDPTKLWLESIDEGILDRMHRFIRLWRALGWQIWEVDLVLSALGIGATTLNSESLRRIAHLHALKQQLTMPIEILATCFGGFADRVYSSIDKHETLKPIVPLYDRIFQNKQLQNPPNSLLTFPQTQQPPPRTLPTLDDALLAAIATALGLRPADLKHMIESGAPDLHGIVMNQPLPLNQNGLLHIWRNLVLAKALRLTLADYIAGCRLLGSNPFASPASLLLFCREMAFVKQTGVDVSTLERALTNRSTPGLRDPWMLLPDEAVTMLSGLQADLRAIRTPEVQPRRPLGITQDDLTREPFVPPADLEARWRRWGLRPPAPPPETRWTVASPYPSTAIPPGPVSPETGEPLSLLKQAAVLAQQARLTVPQLRELLETRYVSPQSPGELAITSGANNRDVIPSLTSTHLDRIEQLVGLQRATQLSFRELDLLLVVAGPASPLQWVVNEGAAILDIRDRLNLPLDTVIAWWGGLGGRQYLAHTAVTQTRPTAQPYPDVFERLFASTNWRLNASRTELDAPPGNWRVEVASLAAAFAVEPLEISYLLDAGIFSSTVKLGNLNILHHWVTLAKALGITTRVLRYLHDRFFPTVARTAVPSPIEFQQFLVQTSTAKQQVDVVEQQMAKATQLDAAVVSDFLLEKLTTLVNNDSRPAVEAFLTSSFLDASFHVEMVTLIPGYGVLLKLRKLKWLNGVWNADRATLNWLRMSMKLLGFAGVIPDQIMGRGLCAEYFNNSTLAGFPTVIRTDTTVDFFWGNGSPDSRLNPDNFSVRWTGQVLAPATGTFEFSTLSDDGVRLWVNGKQLVNDWTTHPPIENKGSMWLSSGERYSLVLEYFENSGGSTMKLSWSGPSISKQIIPSSLLQCAVQYQVWKQTTLLFATARQQPKLIPILEDYRRKLGGGTSRANVNDARTILADAFGLSLADVDRCAIWQQMDTQAGLAADPANPVAQFDPINLSGLIQLLSTLQRLGITAAELDTLISEQVTERARAVTIAQRILRSRFGELSWEEALRGVTDTLRIRQRDRLVDYLLWHNNLRDADALYEECLIDVQMSPCMRTTRLLQSIAAVQLFVQRCLMNLEHSVSPDSLDAKRWEWMQHYRVWEANRKVFLYPENWLHPELRDDRTDTFKSFEHAMTQNEPSDNNALAATRQYLDGLLEIGQIMVLASHVQKETDEVVTVNGTTDTIPIYTLYQLGRSRNPSYTFYWRKCLRFGAAGMRWTGWEKINGDMDGMHTVIFTHEGDLHVAWALLSEVDKNTAELQVQIAWIRYQSTGWTARKTNANGPRTFRGIPGRDLARQIHMQVRYDNAPQRPEVWIYKAPTPNNFQAKPHEPKLKVIQDTGPIWTDTTVRPDNATTKSLLNTFILANPGTVTGGVGITVIPDVHIKYHYNNGQSVHYDELHRDGRAKVYAYLKPEGSSSYQPVANEMTFEMRGNTGVFKAIISHDKFVGASTTDVRIKVQFGGQILKDYEGSGVISKNDAEHYYFISGILPINAPPPGLPSNQDPVLMTPEAHLVFNSMSEVNLEGPGTNPPVLAKPVGTVAELSGFVEQEQVGQPQTNGATISNTPIIEHIIEHSTPGLFRIRPAAQNSGTVQGQDEIWWVEEDATSFLVRTKPPSHALKVLPGSFPETGTYRRDFASGAMQLFDEGQRALELGPWFGMENLGRYFTNLTGAQDPRALPDPAFELRLPNALYNWEVFYHLPMMAASFLSKQHRYAEARRWFHFIFDPTTDDRSPGRERFWRFLPFRHSNQSPTILQLLNILTDPDAPASKKQQVEDQISAWLADPFSPFAIARLRTSAFEWYTLIAYIKNLITWADQLFRRDTRESIHEATLLYVLAANILGRRPEKVSSRSTTSAISYRAMEGKWDSFSNVWINNDSESISQIISGLAARAVPAPLASIGSTYFCVPPNDKILELWDTVGDRLFKIRNCQNFDGVTRSLPLLDPPIDPELLIRARLAGLDLADVLADRYAPLPIYRLQVQIQKATELCNEVKALGASVLSAMEKKEAEHLSLLRSSHEIAMLKLVEQVKQEQIAEAKANIDSLEKSRANIVDKILYLLNLMGADVNYDENKIPIVSESFIGQPLKQLDQTVGDLQGLGLIRSEVDQIVFLQTNNILNLVGGGLHTASGLAHTAGATYAPLPPGTDGPARVADAIGKGLSAFGTLFNTLASHYAMLEKRSGQMAQWQRRRDEWLYQAKTAVAEVKQLDKQIAALNIRKVIAEKELENHRRQMAHTREIDDYIRHQKFAGESLYTWQETQLSGVYFTAYQLAYDQAKRAERAFRFELGDETTNFIQPGHWDGLRKGLMAGELLAQELRRLEVAYLERNRRELEITKHVSLRQLDPTALMSLRDRGECTFELPEWLFDLDFPGHYFRRIKTVSLSIPCVVGPYTSVNGTLALLSSKLRDSNIVKGGSYDAAENYRASYLPVQAIATSTAQNDSGMFELNFRDERYLPFEGAGVVSSRWGLALPKEFRAFDYDTISDVVLHIRYTARDSGSLRVPAVNAVKDVIANTAQAPLQLILDLRRDFPRQWAQAKAAGAAGRSISVTLDDSLYPLMFKGMRKEVSKQYLWNKSGSTWSLRPESAGSNTVTIPSDSSVTDAVVVLQYSVSAGP